VNAQRVPRGLLDTSVIILYGDVADPEVLPIQAYISAITFAELSSGPAIATTEPERIKRLLRLNDVEARFSRIPFDDACARRFADVNEAMRAAGRKPLARSYDALIAATALAHGLPLFTVNPRDFSSIPDLDVVAIPHPSASA
jgi:hypothetical protein